MPPSPTVLLDIYPVYSLLVCLYICYYGMYHLFPSLKIGRVYAYVLGFIIVVCGAGVGSHNLAHTTCMHCIMRYTLAWEDSFMTPVTELN